MTTTPATADAPVDPGAVPTYDVKITTADGPLTFTIPTYAGPHDARQRAEALVIGQGWGAILFSSVTLRAAE